MWLATAVSGFGDGLVFVAFPLLLTTRTNDPRLTAAVVVAGRLPWILLAIPAGAIADRHEHRLLLTLVELGRAALLIIFGLVVLQGVVSVPLILVTVFLVGLGETLFVSGSHAALPSLVSPGDLAQANGVLFSVQTATENLIGPAIAGVVFAAAMAAPFLLDGGSFAVSAVLLFLAVPVVVQRPAPTSSLRTDVREGLKYFKSQPAFRSLAITIAVLAFCQAMVYGIVVLFARDILGLSSVGFGLLVAGAALGNVIGGVFAGRLDARFGPAKLIPASAVVASVAYVFAGLTSNAVISGSAFALEAVAVAVCSVSSVAFRQRTTPPALLGRLNNIYRFFVYSAAPAGALVGGVLAKATSLRWPFLFAAAVQLAAIAALGPTLSRRLTFAVAAASA
jgi:MFS family permease